MFFRDGAIMCVSNVFHDIFTSMIICLVIRMYLLPSPQRCKFNSHPQYYLLWRNMNDSQFLSIQYRSEISPFLTMNIIMLCKLGVIYFRRYSRDESYCDAGQLSSQPHSLIVTRYVNVSVLMKFFTKRTSVFI